jgi:hypothetical protein
MVKRGRPLKKRIVDKTDYGSIERIAALGHTDQEIGTILGVSESTINRWKDDPLFLGALKKGKLVADHNVVKSLYKNAVGYETQEITHRRIELEPAKRRTKTTKAKPAKLGVIVQTVVKQVPGVPNCQFYWTKNRRPDLWRDRKELGLDGSLGIYHDQAKLMTRDQVFSLMTQAIERGEIELNANGEYVLAEKVEPTEKGGHIERKKSTKAQGNGKANGSKKPAPGSNGRGKLRVQGQKRKKKGGNGSNGKG